MFRNQQKDCTPGEAAAPSAKSILGNAKFPTLVLNPGKSVCLSAQIDKKSKLQSRIKVNQPQSILGFLKKSIGSNRLSINKGLIDFDITDEIISLRSNQQPKNVCRAKSTAIV